MLLTYDIPPSLLDLTAWNYNIGSSYIDKKYNNILRNVIAIKVRHIIRNDSYKMKHSIYDIFDFARKENKQREFNLDVGRSCIR